MKITPNNIKKCSSRIKETLNKITKLPEQEPDTFVKEATPKNVSDNLEHLNFEKKNIKFYDEDIKKMKSMTFEEKIEYKAKLKAENRYICED